MLYLRFPLSSRKRWGTSPRARRRRKPCGSPVLVESVLADVRVRNQKTPDRGYAIRPLAMAARKVAREDQRRDVLLVADSDSRMRGSGKLYHQDARQAGSIEIPQENNGQARSIQGHRDRPALVVWLRSEGERR